MTVREGAGSTRLSSPKSVRAAVPGGNRQKPLTPALSHGRLRTTANDGVGTLGRRGKSRLGRSLALPSIPAPFRSTGEMPDPRRTSIPVVKGANPIKGAMALGKTTLIGRFGVKFVKHNLI